MNDPFLSSLPMVASMLGRQLGVHIEIGQTTTAMTNGKTIRLPALPLDEPRLVPLVRGYIDHECGHIRATTFDVLAHENRPLVRALTNILEDVRIEKVMSDEYPGCRYNLDEMHFHLDTPVTEDEKDAHVVSLFDPAEPDWKPIDILNAYVLQKSRSEVLNQRLPTRHLPQTAQVFEASLGAELKREFDTALARTARLGSSADAHALAQELASLIEYDSENSASGGAPSPKAADKAPTPSGGCPADPSASAKTSTDAEASPQAMARSILSDTPDKSGDIGEMLARQIEQASEQAQRDGTALACGDELEAASQSEQEVNRAPGSGLAQATLAGAPVDYARTLAASTQLRNRTQRLLQSETLVRIRPGYSGKHLLSRRLYRVAVGDARIFARRTEQRGFNTLLGVLVDRSGSMDGFPCEMAMQAALSIAAAFETVHGVRVCVAAFPGQTTYTVPLQFPVERSRQACQRYIPDGNGGTPMAEALLTMARGLAPAPEHRKIITVITDGGVNKPAVTRALVDRLTRSGWEILGIGIRVDVSEVIPASCRIGSVEELAGKLFALLNARLHNRAA